MLNFQIRVVWSFSGWRNLCKIILFAIFQYADQDYNAFVVIIVFSSLLCEKRDD